MNKIKLDQDYKRAKELLKDKEELFDIVMDAIGDLVSIQDLKMRIIYQNKAMKEAMGVHEGEYCYIVYEKRDHICEGCPLIKVYKTGGVAKALRVGILPDGTSNRFENVVAALRDKRGKIVAGIEACRDVEIRERAIEGLKNFKNLAVGRELKMVELKKEIEALKKELGKTRF